MKSPDPESGHVKDREATVWHHVIGDWGKSQQLARQSRLTMLHLWGSDSCSRLSGSSSKPKLPLGSLASRHAGNWFDQLHRCCLISKHGHTRPSVSQRLSLGSRLQNHFQSWKSLYLSSSIRTKVPRVSHNRTWAQGSRQVFHVRRAGPLGSSCNTDNLVRLRTPAFLRLPHAAFHPRSSLWVSLYLRKERRYSFHFRCEGRDHHRYDYSKPHRVSQLRLIILF